MAKFNEKLSSFFAVHLQKGISLVHCHVFQTSRWLNITGQVRCVLIFILQRAHGAFVCCIHKLRLLVDWHFFSSSGHFADQEPKSWQT